MKRRKKVDGGSTSGSQKKDSREKISKKEKIQEKNGLKDLPGLWGKIEHFNSKLIPFALILLLLVIIYELFLHQENDALNRIFLLIDYLVILIFVVDVIFLAARSRSVKFFLKHYWLDILAVFPFGFFFSLAEKFYRAVATSEKIVIGQALFHETIEVRKGVAELSKAQKISRYLKIAARSLRVITKSRFFQKLKFNGKKGKQNNVKKNINKNNNKTLRTKIIVRK